MSAALVLALGVGCGDDDGGGGGGSDGGGGGGGGGGGSGDVDGDFEGFATFTQASLDDGSFSLGLTDNDTYHVQLTIQVADNAPPPAGTYSIGGLRSADHFTARFSDLEEGSLAEPVEYSAWNEDLGMLEITSSGEDQVEGTFEFDAQRDMTESPSIMVRDGAFRAVKVAGGGG